MTIFSVIDSKPYLYYCHSLFNIKGKMANEYEQDIFLN
jgi:hypothetical protein